VLLRFDVDFIQKNFDLFNILRHVMYWFCIGLAAEDLLFEVDLVQ